MYFIISDRTKFVIKLTQRVEDYNIVSGSAPGIIYSLHKTNKADFGNLFRLRPNFAAYNSPSFKIAKFQTKVLAP